MRRKKNPRRRLGSVNSTVSPGSRLNLDSMMWSRSVPSLSHFQKQGLIKLNFKTVGFATEAARVADGACLFVNGLYSIEGFDWLIATDFNFSSTATL